MPANQNKKYKIVTRPKSLTTGSKDNINETTTKNINPAEIVSLVLFLSRNPAE